jgi:hypothetical protein
LIRLKYKGTYVKVIVYEKKSEIKFDQFLDSLYAVEPASVSIIEDLSEKGWRRTRIGYY